MPGLIVRAGDYSAPARQQVRAGAGEAGPAGHAAAQSRQGRRPQLGLSSPIFIGVLSTVGGLAGIRRKMSEGRIDAVDLRAPAVLALLPSDILSRAAVIGLACAVLLAAPLWGVLTLHGEASLTLGHAVALKVATTALLSLVIVPVIVASALSDVQRRSRLLAIA